MDDDDLDRLIARAGETIYHPIGTCRMDVDVDCVLRVRRSDSWRVVDASIMLRLVGGKTNPRAIMIAENAADLMRGPTH